MSTCLNLYPGRTGFPTGTTALERKCMGVGSLGGNLSYTTWKNAWAGPLPEDPNGRNCVGIFRDSIYSLNGNAVFDPTAFSRVQTEFQLMLSKYFNTTIDGHNIALPGELGYDDFQHTLTQACQALPGVCSIAQTNLCNGCSRSTISNNSDLVQLCGCFSPNLDPNIYTRNIPKQCDPLCSNSVAAKDADPATGAVATCTDTICVIDNISITATKSTVGNININQVCQGCSEVNGCTCIIDTSVANLASSLGLDDPNLFQNYCPSANSTCIVIDDTKQTSTVVPCGDKFSGTIKPVFDSSIPVIIYIILAIIIIIVLLALAAYIYAASEKKTYFPTYKTKELFEPSYLDKNRSLLITQPSYPSLASPPLLIRPAPHLSQTMLPVSQ
jgi:hypothetical protein